MDAFRRNRFVGMMRTVSGNNGNETATNKKIRTPQEAVSANVGTGANDIVEKNDRVTRKNSVSHAVGVFQDVSAIRKIF